MYQAPQRSIINDDNNNNVLLGKVVWQSRFVCYNFAGILFSLDLAAALTRVLCVCVYVYVCL